MEFCEKCGTRMGLQATKSATRVFICAKCGATKQRRTKPIEVSGAVLTKSTVKVIDDTPAPLPSIEHECTKCQNSTAYWWMVQTRSGDEPSTRFYRCTKCGHTERDYS